MALRRQRLNFKTSPSGMVVPTTADNAALDAVDVTHEHKTNGALGAVGPLGDTAHIPVVTVDAYGHVTALTTALAAVVSGPAADTQVWMPLTTVVGGTPDLVWSGTNNLIPTLGPI